MRKVVLSVIITLCTADFVFAQDIILTRSNSVIRSNIVEISESEITYYEYNNPDGPVYRISIQSVEKIQFRNGSEKLFFDTEKNDKSSTKGEELVYIRRGDYALNGIELPGQDLETLLRQRGYYDTFVSANKQRRWGNALTIVGATASGVGVAVFVSSAINAGSNPSFAAFQLTSGIPIFFVGSMILGTGVALLSIGNGRLRWIASDYNDKRYSFRPELIINGGTGVGIALRF